MITDFSIWDLERLRKEIRDLEGIKLSADAYNVSHLFRAYYKNRLDRARTELERRRDDDRLSDK